MKAVLTLFLLISIAVSAQQHDSNILFKFGHADSVIIASHSSLVVQGKPGKSGTTLELVKENKPNYTILGKTKKLDKISIDSLARILVTPNDDVDQSTVFCFEPHHVIYLFTNNIISYVDLCFDCMRFVTTKDILVSEYVLSNREWKLLESFFGNRTINIETIHR